MAQVFSPLMIIHSPCAFFRGHLDTCLDPCTSRLTMCASQLRCQIESQSTQRHRNHIASKLSGMFRRSASLAILHRKSFAAKLSVSLVLLGHTNRSVKLSHELQRQIALVQSLSRPIPYHQQGEAGEEKRACVSQGMCF